MTDLEVRLALPVNAELGEGLHWDARRQMLWMTDILGRRVIQWDLRSPTWHEWPMPHAVGWVIPCADGDAVMLGLQPGIAKAVLGAPGTEPELQWIARPFGDASALRLNDAKADGTGAIWAGSMNGEDTSRSEGCLFRLDNEGSLSVHDHGYNVANGPAISPDGRTLLHTDSGRRLIYAFDLDAQAGVLSNKRVWRRFNAGEGYPDGMCFDGSGHLWVAHWSAGRVSRLGATGSAIRSIDIPAPLTTNVCFAGPGLDRAFVTTATVGMSTTDRGRFPMAGHLFEILAPDGPGLPGQAYGRRA
jgi:xylono-1,5-lactonase